PAAAEDVLQGPDGLVVAHVVVDGQGDAGLGAAIDTLFGVAVAQGQGLLGEDGSDVPVSGGFVNDGRLRVGRHGDVEHFDGRVGGQVGHGGVTAREVVLVGDGAGVLGVA